MTELEQGVVTVTVTSYVVGPPVAENMSTPLALSLVVASRSTLTCLLNMCTFIYIIY